VQLLPWLLSILQASLGAAAIAAVVAIAAGGM
jgi:hypothetical protein